MNFQKYDVMSCFCYQNLNSYLSLCPLSYENFSNNIPNCWDPKYSIGYEIKFQNTVYNIANVLSGIGQMCNSVEVFLNNAETTRVLNENSRLERVEIIENELKVTSSTESISEICELQITNDSNFSASILRLSSSKESRRTTKDVDEVNHRNAMNQRRKEENIKRNTKHACKVMNENVHRRLKHNEDCKTCNIVVKVKNGQYCISNEWTHGLSFDKKDSHASKETLIKNNIEKENHEKFGKQLPIKSNENFTRGGKIDRNSNYYHSEGIIKLRNNVEETSVNFLTDIKTDKNQKIKNHEQREITKRIRSIINDVEETGKKREINKIQEKNLSITSDPYKDIIELYKYSKKEKDDLSIENAHISELFTHTERRTKNMRSIICSAPSKIGNTNIGDISVDNASQYTSFKGIDSRYDYGILYPDVYQKRGHTNLNEKLLFQIEMNDSFISFQKMMNPQKKSKKFVNLKLQKSKFESRTVFQDRNKISYNRKRRSENHNTSFLSLKNYSISKCSTSLSGKTKCLKRYRHSFDTLKTRSAILQKSDHDRLKKIKNNNRRTSVGSLKRKNILDDLTIHDLQPILSEYHEKYEQAKKQTKAKYSFLSKLLHDPSQKMLLQLLRTNSKSYKSLSHNQNQEAAIVDTNYSEKNSDCNCALRHSISVSTSLPSQHNSDKTNNKITKINNQQKTTSLNRKMLRKNKLTLNSKDASFCEKTTSNTSNLLPRNKYYMKNGQKRSLRCIYVQNCETYKTEKYDCTEKHRIENLKGGNRDNITLDGLSNIKLGRTIDQRKLWSHKYGKSVSQQQFQFIERQPEMLQQNFHKYIPPVINTSKLLKNKISQKDSLETINSNCQRSCIPTFTKNATQETDTNCKKMERFEHITSIEREITSTLTNMQRNRCLPNSLLKPPKVTTPQRLENLRNDLDTISDELLTLLKSILAQAQGLSMDQSCSCNNVTINVLQTSR